MLIRWATKEERAYYGFNKNDHGEFHVLIAVNRMNNDCIGILGFSRDEKKITKVEIFDDEKRNFVLEKLNYCANNQINPKGNSFHYKYQKYAKKSIKKFCPCCMNLPMPDGMEDIAELKYSYVTAQPKAQGRLFGNCFLTSKYHSIQFYDMPKEEMAGFMNDVQKTAEVLHRVTGAVKINYEMHGNTGPHLHCHLFPRYLDDDFPSNPINHHILE